MQSQLLLSFEGLEAHGADIGPLRIVRLLVPREMVLPLEAGAANIAHESTLERMPDKMLFQQFLLGVRHMALRTAVQSAAIERRRQPNLTRFRARLLLLLHLLLFLFLGSGGGGRWRRRRIQVAERAQRVDGLRPQQPIRGAGERVTQRVAVGMQQVDVIGHAELLLRAGALLFDSLRGVLEEVV